VEIRTFQIKNFKGISDCTLEIERPGSGRIITLIGLNESGKTTVLEALSNFISEDEDLSSLVGTHRPEGYTRDFVPKHRKANFTGTIELRATLRFEEEDRQALSKFFRDTHFLILDTAALPSEFPVAKVHKFKNSEPEASTNTWDVTFQLRTSSQKNFRTYGGSDEITRKIWLDGVRFLGERVPRICYFPTFLFEVPERIYLEETRDETDDDTSAYYRQILQDVLDSQGEGLSLQDHVVKRIKRERDAATNPMALFARFLGLDSKEQIDAVFRKMSSELSKVIFGAWNEIFRHRPKNKHISVEWGIDVDQGNAAFAQFFIVDGDSKYALTERSLGFRWFFCFLLFTRFRISRRQGVKTYFLFDEPASNLHSRAQLQLLASFPNIAGERNIIMYSTHSHYMIQPLWLERAYIVVNKAIDYDKGNDNLDYFSTMVTDISVERYRHFVSQHPDRPTYFQPVLDRLDYVVPPLIGSANCLVLEGKQDFCAMKYFLPSLGCTDVDILPGTGAGNMSTLISLFVGWGRKFLILLDDDKAGRIQKARYIDDYLLTQNEVATFGDIAPEFEGRRLEDLFSPSLGAIVQNEGELTRKPTKKDFALFFQLRLAESMHLDLDDMDAETRETMQLVAKFVTSRLHPASEEV
jgi:energy-coupling factor transporter ATP-binding protein EcfA2